MQIRILMSSTFALLLTTATASADMDKSKFKEGCESGASSYVENRDGSFQCNLIGGGTIKCPDTHSQCTYTATMTNNLIFDTLKAGDLRLIPTKSKSGSKKPMGFHQPIR
jgi:hypothetical protein